MIKTMEPKVIFEDEEILVLDKPAGMVVNKAESVKGETVQDWVENYLKILSTKHEILNKSQIQNSKALKSLEFRNSNLEFSRRNGVVHRIDKETSGVLLIAKTPEAFGELQRQFKDREVEKKYIALVHGRVVPEEGTIKADVGRLPWNRERFGVLPGGREAETRYKVIATWNGKWEVRSGLGGVDERWGKVFADTRPTSRPTLHIASSPLTFLILIPKTGRTHQIRVHLKSLGHPIVSDPLYAGRKTARLDRKWCPRLFLHAASISFAHPQNSNKTVVTSQLPKDLKQALQKLH